MRSFAVTFLYSTVPGAPNGIPKMNEDNFTGGRRLDMNGPMGRQGSPGSLKAGSNGNLILGGVGGGQDNNNLQFLSMQNPPSLAPGQQAGGINGSTPFAGFGNPLVAPGAAGGNATSAPMFQQQLAWRQTFPGNPLLQPGLPGIPPNLLQGGQNGLFNPNGQNRAVSGSGGLQSLQSLRDGNISIPHGSDLVIDSMGGRTAAENAKLTGRNPAMLYMTCDDDSLSEYQCLVRKQIELFEARREEVESNAKGRNKPIVLGQVGIRCRHCSMLNPRHRSRGAMYYPAKLNGLYQAAQSMASGHLCFHCQHIPDEIRQELLVLRERKSSAGGGKKYWGDGVRVLGVFEDEDGLRFKKR